MPEDPLKNIATEMSFPDLQNMLMNAPVGIFTSTPEGRYISVNPALARMYGYDSPEELIESVTDIAGQVYVDPFDREDFIRLMKEQGEVVNHESRRLRRDGTVFWVSMNARAVRDEEGRIVAYQGFTTDITERKITEEKASKSKQTLVTILEHLPADVYVSDLQDHTVLYMNKSMRQSFGRDCTGELCYEVFNNASSPCSHCKKPSLLDDQHRPTGIISWEWYNPVVKKWYKNEDQAIPWNGEKLVHIQLATDISDRKSAEGALAESEKKYRELFETAPVGIFQTTPDGRFISINSEYARIFGYESRKEMMSLINDITGELYVHSKDRERYKELLRKQVHVKDFETRLKRRDGDIFWVSMNTRVKYGPNNEIIYDGFLTDITERKRAEEKSREREVFIKSTLDNLPVGVSINSVDPEVRFTYMNDNFAKFYRTTREALAALNDFWEVVYQEPEFREKIKSRVLKDCASGDLDRMYWEDVPVTRPGQETFYITAKNIPLPESDLMVSTVWDVTKRKKAEERNRDAHHRLLTILNSINALIYVADMDTYEILFANQLLNDTHGDIEGEKCWSSLQKGQTGPCDFCTNHKLLDNEGKPTGFYRWEFQNTRTGRWYECQDVAIKWIDDRTVRLEIAIDITERKQAENKLRESEKRYREILDSIEDGYFECNLAGTVTFCNPATARMTGYTIEECKGLNFRKICVDPEKAFNLFNRVLQSLRSEPSVVLELIRKDGSTGFAESLISPIINPKGRVKGFRGLGRDVTERKLAAEEKEKLQSQLFQAQKMESIGMLSGGLAHDFNNLLHAMGGNLELLDKKLSKDHPGKKRVKAIQNSMDRAAHLVKQMLLFSRKADIQIQVLDLNLEIHDAAKLLERSIPKMVNIELILDENARPINADPIQVEQMLLNLGTNAADVMPDGGRLIIETTNVTLDQDFVRTHAGGKPGKYVLMTVSDTGCGMDKETLQHIFDPFFTTKEVGKGTGLGLASVYGIIKAHEGYITCYSEPGQGTTFKIYWPAAEQGEIEPDEIQTEQAVTQDGTETILVVDDDDQIRDLARELLEDSGYRVLGAASGEQALKIFTEHAKEIDLVVMDLNMPGMGGRKCTREMLSIDPSVKVLVASGYSANGHGSEALGLGARDFISKPFQMREILAKIRKVLDGDQR
jgi:PAS domain S-box-containing protein